MQRTARCSASRAGQGPHPKQACAGITPHSKQPAAHRPSPLQPCRMRPASSAACTCARVRQCARAACGCGTAAWPTARQLATQRPESLAVMNCSLWRQGWYRQGAEPCASPNFGARPVWGPHRPAGAARHQLAAWPVRHTAAVQQLFTNQLDWDGAPLFSVQIQGLEVSSHFFIERGAGKALAVCQLRRAGLACGRLPATAGATTATTTPLGLSWKGLEGESVRRRAVRKPWASVAAALLAQAYPIASTSAGHDTCGSGPQIRPRPWL
jgi:N-acetyl-anhydromuramoyl-L-alanine amidase